MYLQRWLLLLSLVLSSIVRAQSYDKEFIMTLPDTSKDVLPFVNLTFGPGDEYCYHYRPYQDSSHVFTNAKVYGRFANRSRVGNCDCIFYKNMYSGQYLKNRSNAIIYGPYDGKIDCAYGGPDYLVYTILKPDSASYYINGKLLATVDSTGYTARNSGTNWFAFSYNGNILYTIRNGMWSYLYMNNELLDSSTHYFGMLDVDDDNNYLYAIGDFEKHGYRYMFKPLFHKPRRMLYKRDPWRRDIHWRYNDSDTLYYYGNQGRENYLNRKVFDKPVDSSTVKVIFKGKTTFSYVLSESQTKYNSTFMDSLPKRICVNGVGLDLPYERILLAAVDSSSNYALFGYRDYYMYKNINGVEQKPLSKHGVRAVPVSIDPMGNIICYYETDDSVYVYVNDKLFRSCAVEQFDSDAYIRWETEWWVDKLPAFSIDGIVFIVYNNAISPPVSEIIQTPYGDEIMAVGNVIHAYYDGNDYWLLQKTGTLKYDLIINNKKVKLPSGVNFEYTGITKLAQNFKLAGNEFVFYTQEGADIYRYKLKL